MTSLREWLAAEQRVAIQGISGRVARAQLPALRQSGTNVVAGVVPERRGDVDGIPVFPSVGEAKAATGCNVSIVAVPPAEVRAACLDAIEAEIALAVVLTEGVPVLDAVAIRRARARTLLVGANTPGMAVVGVAKLGFMSSELLREGDVALVSRSGTLSYEVAQELADLGGGVSTWIGVGGDPVPLLDLSEAVRLALEDPRTRALVLVGEVGGDAEERLADGAAATPWPVPVHALVVGRMTTPDRPMGHAGAVVRDGVGLYDTKVSRLRAAGVTVHDTPWGLASALSAAARPAR